MDYINHYSPKYLEQLSAMLEDKQKFEFFAGIGLMATGTHQFRLKCANEIVGKACQVLQRNFPSHKYGADSRFRPRIVNGTLHQNDLTTNEDWGESACIVVDRWVRNQGVCYVHASPPCQGHSMASAENSRKKEGNAKNGGGDKKQEAAQEEHGSTSVRNPLIASAIKRFVLAYRPTYFTVEQVVGFFVSDVGKQLYSALVDNGYNVQIVTMQAALHHDEDHLGNIRFGLSSRVRSVLLASRRDVTTIQIENPSMNIPGRNNFAAFGTPEILQFIKDTKLETSNQKGVLQIPSTMGDRFRNRTEEAGLSSVPNLPSCGHVIHPTKYKCYEKNLRTDTQIDRCRISGCVSCAVMTTPTTAGKAPNEVMPTYPDQNRTITPGEAAVLMGITNLGEETTSREPRFHIVLDTFDPTNREDWDQAFKGVGNGVPIGMARAIGKAVERAVDDSRNKTISEKNRQEAMILKREKAALAKRTKGQHSGVPSAKRRKQGE